MSQKQRIFLLGLCFFFSVVGFGETAERPRRPSAQEIQAALERLPQEYRADVHQALHKAGVNGRELIRAIDTVPSAEEREALAFLIANMPSRDLRGLSAEYLLTNVRYAYQAKSEVPWGANIPHQIFLNDVLPYASVNERRDNWRADFYKRFIKIAQESGTIEKVVKALNQQAFAELQVEYHAINRPKPDQSPYESMAAHYASCTGLSILLIDVLRSVGIPARMAAVPLWKDLSGNHTWVEVWDGDWHFVGAAEPGEYDRTWFTQKAAETDPADFHHRIYAASFKRTALKFPMVWNRKVHFVSAVDVTARYITPAKVSQTLP